RERRGELHGQGHVHPRHGERRHRQDHGGDRRIQLDGDRLPGRHQAHAVPHPPGRGRRERRREVTGKGDAANPIALATGATTAPIVVSNVTVDPVLANDIITGPAGFYFNVHSTVNGGGVVRGQLTPGS